MGYSFDSRVRFSETGTDQKLTLPAMLDYFQDCCTFQVDSIHQGIKELAARKRVWVLNSWQVIINRYPEVGENIRITTYPYRLVRCFGHRNFTMETQEGELLSIANSLWTNLDMETGHPARLTEEDLRGYVMDEKLDMPYSSRKILPPDNSREEEPFAIQKHHLDANHHVNNCQYIWMAMDYLPEGCRVAEMRAEYHKQAFLGDLFCPTVAEKDGVSTVMFRAKTGELFASAEFKHAES